MFYRECIWSNVCMPSTETCSGISQTASHYRPYCDWLRTKSLPCVEAGHRGALRNTRALSSGPTPLCDLDTFYMPQCSATAPPTRQEGYPHCPGMFGLDQLYTNFLDAVIPRATDPTGSTYICTRA